MIYNRFNFTWQSSLITSYIMLIILRILITYYITVILCEFIYVTILDSINYFYNKTLLYHSLFLKKII